MLCCTTRDSATPPISNHQTVAGTKPHTKTTSKQKSTATRCDEPKPRLVSAQVARLILLTFLQPSGQLSTFKDPPPGCKAVKRAVLAACIKLGGSWSCADASWLVSEHPHLACAIQKASHRCTIVSDSRLHSCVHCDAVLQGLDQHSWEMNENELEAVRCRLDEQRPCCCRW